MRTILIIFFVISLAFTYASCSKYDQKIEIKDLIKAQTIILNKKTTQGVIQAIRISGTGNIDGKAKIILILNNEPYKTEELTGKFSFSWGGDWYADSAEIKYVPIRVNSGTLSIEYKFTDI